MVANPTPKQTKLLGAHVRDLGMVVAVSSTLAECYAIIEGEDWVNRRVPLADLKHDEVEFPAAAQPFVRQVERVGYGTFDEVYSLVPAQAVLAVAA